MEDKNKWVVVIVVMRVVVGVVGMMMMMMSEVVVLDVDCRCLEVILSDSKKVPLDCQKISLYR